VLLATQAGVETDVGVGREQRYWGKKIQRLTPKGVLVHPE
jgi:hypothetical protein